MKEIISDLKEEYEVLDAIVSGLDEKEWNIKTPFLIGLQKIQSATWHIMIMPPCFRQLMPRRSKNIQQICSPALQTMTNCI